MTHRAIIKLALLAVLIHLSKVADAQQIIQGQPASQATEPQPPASLQGTVLRAGSNPPAVVPRARIVLSTAARGVNPPPMLTIASDDAGRFSLRDIPPGTYSLMATRDGYVRASKPIVLAPRDSLTNVVLEMTPTGAIAGRIRNRAGDPVGNATVQAERYAYRDGRRVLTNVQSAVTNDLGEFRLFYLPPGKYVISATPYGGPRVTPGPPNRTPTLMTSALPGTPLVGPGATGPAELPEIQMVEASASEFLSVGLLPLSLTGAAYVPVYFPGTMDASAATAIDLAPGADFRNADFVVSEARSTRIRGRVINGVTGEPGGGATLMLISKDPGGGLTPARQNGKVAPDGTFELAGVAPGSYDLAALVGTLPPGLTSGGVGNPAGAAINPGGGGSSRPGGPAPQDFAVTATGIRLAARVPIQVSGADIDNVVLTAQVGYTLKGRITMEGRSPEESQKQLEGVVVQLMPTSYDFETAAMPGIVHPDGSFTVVGALPGTYQIFLMGASNMQNGLVYVKSATLGVTDVINPRFVIDGEPPGELEIVVSTARGIAEVSVTDAKQSPAAAATVVLVPDTLRRQHYELYQRGQTNNSGIAQMGGIPVGDYVAYAFENIEPNSWWDPEVMQKYSGQGTPVRIDANSRQQLNLKVIPSR